MFCPNCGTKNQETATTCTSCGFALAKSGGASKFKGTMVMSAPSELQGSAAPAPAPAPASAPAPGPGSAAPAPKQAFKGTMIGVAPPGLQHAPGTTPSTGGPAPSPAPAGFGAPAPTPAQPGFGGGQGVNPLGGTMAIEQMPMPPQGFGTPQSSSPPASPQPSALAPDAPAAAPAASGFEPPAQPGFGAPPAPGFGGAPGFGAQQPGFGAPPHAGYGAAPGGFAGGAMAPHYGGQMAIPGATPQREWLVTLLLCLFLGGLGVHRFYVGKTGSGIAQLVTLGGCGFWSLFDLIMIAMGKFTDSEGRPLLKQ